MIAEYFDLYDADGNPLGASKPREQVHRDGDWHRSIALWIVRARGSLVVQRRSLSKDTHPGAFTASVSGHYAAGEHIEQVLREAQEEIGVAAVPGDLVPVCVWRNDERPAPDMIDRELMDVFLWPMEQDLASFTPDPNEVMGLAEIDASAFLALLNGARKAIPALWMPVENRSIMPIDLVESDFVPAADYHRRVVLAALKYLSETSSETSRDAVKGQRGQALSHGETSADTP